MATFHHIVAQRPHQRGLNHSTKRRRNLSWSISNRNEAILAGADLEEDRLLLAITPGYVAERY